MVRTLGIALDLLPEVLDIRIAAPHFAEDELVGQHLARMGHEQAEDVVLTRREPYLLAPHGDEAAHEIDGEIAAAEERPLALLLQPVPEGGAYPGMELVDT